MRRPDQDPIRIFVNGHAYGVEAAPETPLLYILRNDLTLNGPKFGCGLGECGACTVLVEGRAARSCVVPLGAVRGREVTTLEGLTREGELHAVQEAFIAEDAAQCGYCLNGMIMSITALLARNPDPSDAEIRIALRYNLCRCGTHIEILRAAHRAAASVRAAAAAEPPTPGSLA